MRRALHTNGKVQSCTRCNGESCFADASEPYYTGSFFETVDKFDASFFGISPKEAEMIDPQQRMYLQAVWEAVEDAGLAASFRKSNTGVYVGNTMDRYRLTLTSNSGSISHGNHPPFIASRVSYTFDLQGPAMMVSTGCSSSLLAVHLACQGLVNRDCDLALAGGITLDILPLALKCDIWTQLGITKPGQKCYAFDSRASGIAKGEGCGVVVLKRMDDAIRDGNHIYGELIGTGTNQDGHSNGITAPNPTAQAKLLQQVWRERAHIHSDDIDYFEAHGTGTELSDPIEVLGIKMACSSFPIAGANTAKQQHTHATKYLGSVKANIGHLADGAAGVVSLIKVVLCMKAQCIPPQINYAEPNPKINWQNLPFQVNTTVQPWPSNPKTSEAAAGGGRIGVVSSFGLVGTNVHVVLKEYHHSHQKCTRAGAPNTNTTSMQPRTQSIFVSTKSLWSTRQLLTRIRDYVELRAENKMSTESEPMLPYPEFVQLWNGSRAHANFDFKFAFNSCSYQEAVTVLEDAIDSILKSSLNDGVLVSSLSGHSWLLWRHGITSKESRAALDAHLFKMDGQNSEILKQMLAVGTVDFARYYQHEHGRRLVWKPIDIYYPFDEQRYWPKPGHPIFLGPPSTSSSFVNKKQMDDQSSWCGLQKAFHAVSGWKLESSHWGLNLWQLGFDSLMVAELKDELRVSLGQIHLTTEQVNQLTLNELGCLIEEQLRIPAEGQNSGVSGAATIERLSSKPAFVLVAASEAQRRIWLLESFWHQQRAMHRQEKGNCDAQTQSPEYCAYNVANGLKINGHVNVQALVDSFDYMLSAHDSLRTSFQEADGKVYQKVHAYIVGQNTASDEGARLQFLDWSGTNEHPDETEHRAVKLYEQVYRQEFDLSQPSGLIRAYLVKIQRTQFLFFVVAHHIIMDGQSHYIFYRDLWTAYRHISRGARDCMPPVSNTMMASLQKTEGKEMRVNLGFWETYLASFDFGEPCAIPGDKVRPQLFTSAGKRLVFLLDEDELDILTPDGPITTFQKLLTLVYITMYMYSGKTDLLIGCPVSGRNSPNLANVIGFFVNLVPIRIQLGSDDSFRNVLTHVSTQTAMALEHGKPPFDVLVNSIRDISRDPAWTPIFSVSTCYHSKSRRSQFNGSEAQYPEDWEVERVLPHNGSAKWDLYFDFLHETVGKDAGKLRFTLEYYSDLYTDEFANNIASSFLELLTRFNELVSTDYALQQIHAKDPIFSNPLNLARLDGPTTKLEEPSFSLALYKAMRRQPGHKIALFTNDQQITYDELLQRSLLLANFIRDTNGIGSRVGLLLETKHTFAVVSLLACLLSGTTFVPLDPENPTKRTLDQCSEAGCQLVIFSSKHTKLAEVLRWGQLSPVRYLLCIDALVQDLGQLSIGNISEDEVAELSSSAVDLTDVAMWDTISTRGQDNPVEVGGWFSSFTGLPFSETEMNEYSQNVYTKLTPYLRAGARVLEIGCGSGLTTKVLAPLVAEYYACDSSSNMVQFCHSKFEPLVRSGKLKCFQAYAHSVEQTLQDRNFPTKFDVIVINSVVHNFPTHSYLTQVVGDLTSMLVDDEEAESHSQSGTGTRVFFIGDILDQDKQDQLLADLRQHSQQQNGSKVKLDWSNELFLRRSFWPEIMEATNGSGEVNGTRIEITDKIHRTQNELVKYRYDVIISMEARRRTKQTVDKMEKWVSKLGLLGYFDYSHLEKCKVKCNEDDEAPGCWIDECNLETDAYILFTSGTTGQPKQVVIAQQSLYNYVQWATRTYEFGSDSVTPLFSKLTFDFTLTSIFCPLISGGQIRLYGPFQLSHKEMSSNMSLTHVKLSPLQLQLMANMCLNEYRTLTGRVFVIGGEQLTKAQVRLLFEATNLGTTVFNEYGPTEATVGCVCAKIIAEDLQDPLFEVLIGQPIDNTSIVCTSIEPQPVLRGVRGRACLSGINICKNIGTIQNQARISGILVTDDMVSVSTKGMVHFYGRIGSTCAKVNDIRVDLKEIEREILSVAGVQGAWLELVSWSENSDKKDGDDTCACSESRSALGAFVQVLGGTNTDSSTPSLASDLITAHLRARVPREWIPTIWSLSTGVPPLNKNGKVDKPTLCNILKRQRTQPHKKEQGDAFHSNNAPHGWPTKEDEKGVLILQQTLARILHLGDLPSMTDNYFELGGDSIGVLHLIRMLTSHGLYLSYASVFKEPTLEQIWQAIHQTKAETTKSRRAECDNQDQDQYAKHFIPTPICIDYLNNVAAADGDLDESAAASAGCKDPASEFALPMLVELTTTDGETKLPDFATLVRAWSQLVELHESLRSVFVYDDAAEAGKWVQSLIPMNSFKILSYDMVVHASDVSSPCIFKEPQFKSIVRDLESQLDIRNGPVSCFVRLPYNGSTYLLLVAHHLCVDNISWAVLLDDFAFLLNRQGLEPLPLPMAHTLRLFNYCTTLQNSTATFDEEIPFWTRAEQRVMETEACKPKANFIDAKFYQHSINRNTLSTLSALCGEVSEESVILAMAIFNFNLNQSSSTTESAGQNEPDVAICMEGHGRHRLGLDACRTVGWLTSRYPVIIHNTDRDRSTDLPGFIKTVHAALLSVPARGANYDVLRATGRLTQPPVPNPRVMFVHLGLISKQEQVAPSAQLRLVAIPWIEIIQDDLRGGRLHRHPDAAMEFDIEIITWTDDQLIQFGFVYNSVAIDEAALAASISSNCATADAIVVAESARVRGRKRITCHLFPSFHIPKEMTKCVESKIREASGMELDVHVSIKQPYTTVMQLWFEHSERQFSRQAYQHRSGKADDPENHVQLILVTATELANQKYIQSWVDTLEATRQTWEGSQGVLFCWVGGDGDGDQSTNDKIATKFPTIRTGSLERDGFADEWDYDPTNEYGVIFNQLGYNKLANSVGRHLLPHLLASPFKVLLVDADDTLWSGEAAAGAASIDVSPTNYYFQTFLLDKKRAGYLLVLMSKNVFQDVQQVFESRQDVMLLSLDHFVSVYCNWKSKWENVRELVNELQLSSNSFIFFDDSVLECVEMLTYEPEVLTILVPQSLQTLQAVLSCVWPLSQNPSFVQRGSASGSRTYEAQHRTIMYKAEIERKKALAEATKATKDLKLGLEKLLVSWRLSSEILIVRVSDLRAHHPESYSRACELLQRTNQFKMNVAVLSMNDQAVEKQDICLLATLQDCFGYYGIVSVVLLANDGLKRHITQWVISCRALGRTLEQSLLACIADLQYCNGQNDGFIKPQLRTQPLLLCDLSVHFQPTGRNEPAARFLKIHGFVQDGDTEIWSLSSNKLDTETARTTESSVVTLNFVDSFTQTRRSIDESETATQHRNKSNSETSTAPKFNYNYRQSTEKGQIETVLEGRNFVRSLPKELKEQVQSRYFDLPTEAELNFDAISAEFKVSKWSKISNTGDLESIDSLSRYLSYLWQKQVGCDPTPDSNFFSDHGGQSINAVFLISELMSVFPDHQLKLQIVDLIENPTFARFVGFVHEKVKTRRELSSHQNADENAQLNKQPTQRKTWVKLSLMQQRLALLQELNPSSTAYTETIAILFHTHKPASFQELVANIYAALLSKFPILATVIRIDKKTGEVGQVLDNEIQNLTSLPSYEVWVETQTEAVREVRNHLPSFMLSPVPSIHARLPLTFDVFHPTVATTSKRDTRFLVTWSPDCVSTQVAKGLLANYAHTCSQLLDNHARTHNSGTDKTRLLSKIDLVCSEEREIISSFERRRTPADTELQFKFHWPDYTPLPLFKRHCTESPDRIAVIDGHNQKYTYGQLERMAHCIAERLGELLREKDVTTTTKCIILLVMDKGEVSAIASIFAVWSLGICFLPIDSELQETLRFITNDSATTMSDNIICVLTNLALSELNEEAKLSWPVLSTQNILDTEKISPPRRRHRLVNNAGPAYVMLTSGSTGAPKKCVVSHEALAYVIKAWEYEHQLEDDSTSSPPLNVLQWALFSFDVFMGDLCKALCCTTGTLTLLPAAARLDVEQVGQIMSTARVTFVEFTPQFAHHFCEVAPGHQLKRISHFVCGSDMLSWETVGLLHKTLPSSIHIYNSYGLTEATIDTTIYRIPRNPQEWPFYQHVSPYVPIGHPMHNLTVQVLNPVTKLPSPLGSPGVLAIYGQQVAEIQLPTTKVNLNQNQSKEDVFMTGDIVTWLPCGNLVSFGREQHNAAFIKIRGFRVSPHHVAQVASEVLGVRETMVFDVFTAQGNSSNEAGYDAYDTSVLCLAIFANQVAKLPNEVAMRQLLAAQLPSYMLPQIILVVVNREAYLNRNGKLDLRSLRRAALDQLQTGPRFIKTALLSNDDSAISPKTMGMVNKLQNLLSKCTGRPTTSIVPDLSFRDQGFSSLSLMKFANILRQSKDERVRQKFKGIVDLFTYTTLNELALHLEVESNATNCALSRSQRQVTNFLRTSSSSTTIDDRDNRICIVGLALRLPGPDGDKDDTTTLSKFCSQLTTSCVRPFPAARLEALSGFIPNDSLNKFPQASYLSRIDQFDHRHFRIAPREAMLMCPEQRILLHLATEALLDAGLRPEQVSGGNVSVYVAACESQYGTLFQQQQPNHDHDALGTIGRLGSMLAGRVAYHLNLKGSNAVVDTSCSSALAALALGMAEIQSGRCALSLVCGVNLMICPNPDGITGNNAIQSPDFKCRPFDVDRNGTVCGEGGFAYLLKPLSEALKNGDTIYCVLESCARNSVGKGNGVTAPSMESQTALLQTALVSARLTSDQIALVETHGTGTLIGDQIELAALNQVFHAHNQSSRPQPRKCILSATKPNFGHLDSSAGFLGLLKLIACFATNRVPALLHLETPDPSLNQAVFQTGTLDGEELWPLQAAEVCYGLVSAFGMSGSNYALIACRWPSANTTSSLILTHKPSHGIFTNTTSHWPPKPKFNINKASASPQPPANLCTILTKKLISCRQLVATLQLEPPNNYEGHMNEFCNSLIADLLSKTRLGKWFQVGAKMSVDSAFAHSGFHQKYRKLFLVMIRQLLTTGCVTATAQQDSDSLGTIPSEFEVVQGLSFILGNGAKMPSHLAQLYGDKYPAYSDCFRFPLYCSQFYMEVLAGNMSPLSVIYPKGNLDFMYQYDKVGDVLGDIYFELYLQTIATYINKMVKEKRREGRGRGREDVVRVLEVGAGMGHVTRRLLPLLVQKNGQPPSFEFEYWFTDLGNAFVKNAKRVLAEYEGYMRFGVFDITKSLDSQNLDELIGNIDVLISYNVVHTTGNIRETLTNLATTLSPATGQLCLIESSKNESWSTLAWGLLDGWWYFADHDLRPYDPMLDKQTWTNVLGTIFPSVHVCPDHGQDEHVEKVLYICSTATKVHQSQKIPAIVQQRSNEHILTESSMEEGKKKKELLRPLDKQSLDQLDLEKVTKLLSRIWMEALGVDHVMEEDTFQELGGESLLAIQMMQAVTATFGSEAQLEIAHVYAYPSLGALANFIHQLVRLKASDADASTLQNGVLPQTKSSMLLFPGQGAQKLNMFASLMANESAKALILHASKVLGLESDLATLFTHPHSLERTDLVQVGLFVSSLAKVAEMQVGVGGGTCLEEVGAVGGLSVGEFAALVFAEAIDFESALQLVHQRGKYMQELVNEDVKTGLISVVGPERQALEAYLVTHFPQLTITAYLGDNQHTVGGPLDDCKEFVHLHQRKRQQQSTEKATTPTKSHNQFELSIIDVRLLRVAAAFHSHYMQKASDKIGPFIQGLSIRRPKFPVIMNASGRAVVETEEIRAQLHAQLMSPVQWKQSMLTAASQLHVRHFIEVSPSCVLTPIIKCRIKGLSTNELNEQTKCTAVFIRV